MTSVAYVSKHFSFFVTDFISKACYLGLTLEPYPPPPPTWNIRKGYLLRLSCKLKVVPSFLCQGVKDEEKRFF